MSRNFPTDKDNIIDDLDEKYGLELTDEDYGRLRKLTQSDLLLLAVLFARSAKALKKQIDEERNE